MRRLGLIAGLVALAVVLIACGGEEEEPVLELEPSAASSRGKIRGAVDRFNIAAEELDAKLLCNDVLPPSSIGDPERCETAIASLMRANPENWEPYGTVRKIRERGDVARARGVQGDSRTTINFVSEGDRWYVEVFD